MRRFTVARLLEREDFTQRMAEAQPISALELLYPVLQGYDSVAVDVRRRVRRHRPEVQPAVRPRRTERHTARPPQSILTLPILPGTDGVRKMSKSYDNYVGVDDPPDEMFGKLMSIPDSVMGEYFLLLLGEPLDESKPAVEAKRELARRLTDRFHGEGAGAAAEAALRPGARAPRAAGRDPRGDHGGRPTTGSCTCRP